MQHVMVLDLHLAMAERVGQLVCLLMAELSLAAFMSGYGSPYGRNGYRNSKFLHVWRLRLYVTIFRPPSPADNQ